MLKLCIPVKFGHRIPKDLPLSQGRVNGLKVFKIPSRQFTSKNSNGQGSKHFVRYPKRSSTGEFEISRVKCVAGLRFCELVVLQLSLEREK